MFAERSSSYTSGVDYLTCVQTEHLQPGQSWQGCGTKYGTGSIRQYSEGDPHLREETGYTDSLGMVAQLGRHHSFTLDGFRIHLEDQVGIIGADTVLRYAAECQLGFDATGAAVDAGSPKCLAMLARVTRGQKDRVTSVITSPFNTGMRQQDGFDFTWLSQYKGTPWGDFSLRFGYTHILKTLERYLPEDAVEDVRDAQWNSEFRTRSYATLGWELDRFNANLHINRLGTSPERWADTYKRLPAWTTANLSLGWRFSDALWAGISVTNVLDRRPELVASEKWWPYADISKYNPTGAEYFLTVEYRLK
jgi:outer membrane receptor protein involved in Fe transport